MNTRAVPFVVLATGVLIASSSSILVRVAQDHGVASIAIGAWRMTIASLLITPWAIVKARADVRAMTPRDRWIAIASGGFLALHFALWISSLAYTSVASSAALVTTNPIWVGLASAVLLRERLARASIVGIAVTMVGSALILVADNGGATARPDPLLGNLLALGGAIAVSGYFLTGRALRARVGLLAYVWIAYGVAAVVLLVAARATDAALWGFAWPGVAALVGLALGPQLLGHTSFNWSLRRLSATFVALSILGEPIGSAVFAFVLFGEHIAPLQALGFAVLLGGIAIAAIAERTAAARQRAFVAASGEGTVASMPARR